MFSWPSSSYLPAVDVARLGRSIYLHLDRISRQRGVLSTLFSVMLKYLVRYAGMIEDAAAKLSDTIEKALASLAQRAIDPLQRVAMAIPLAILHVVAAAFRHLTKIVEPILTAAINRGTLSLRNMRRYRYGRYASNGVGAAASFVLGRAVVITGPYVGAMIYAPLEIAFFALGLQDLRMMLVFALFAMAGLLKLYSHLGFFD